MSANYADSLKKAWEVISCYTGCPDWGGDREYCPGHAALLEVVDAVHVRNCHCRLGRCVACSGESRRLRAVVGVEAAR